MSIERIGDVLVLRLGTGENRVTGHLIDNCHSALDRVERMGPPRALVTTGHRRFYSTGLDLDHVRSQTETATAGFLTRFDQLLARLLAAPFITVAAINGHCVAAGALLATAHDYRVMHSDRGFFALPSVDVGIPFTRGMIGLIRSRLPAPVAHRLCVSGDRIGGRAAFEAGIVDEAVAGDRVFDRATELAAGLADKDPETLGTIKRRLAADAISALEG